MTDSNHQNFDLEFHESPTGYKVKARSLACDVTHLMTLPFPLAQARRFIIELEIGITQNTAARDLVKTWGGNLFEATVANHVRAIYRVVVIIATGEFHAEAKLTSKETGIITVEYLDSTPPNSIFGKKYYKLLLHRQSHSLIWKRVRRILLSLTKPI